MSTLREMMFVPVVTSLYFLSWVSCGIVEDISNFCLDTDYHKKAPGEESQLFSECTPWKDRACCTANTTKNIEMMRAYNFNFDHCAHVNRSLSPQCKQYFQRDMCFFECDPNLGLWVMKVKMKTRNERLYKVPLCASQCDAWFEACKEDYTCAKNWVTDFKWNQTNKCAKDCITFKDMYGSAENFCQQVWDDSWEYTPDKKPCMKLWFDPLGGNPNDAVFLDRVKRSSKPSLFTFWNVFYLVCAFILMVLSFVGIFYLKIMQRRRRPRIEW